VYALKRPKSGEAGEHESFGDFGDLDGNGFSDILIVASGRIKAVILPRQDEDGKLYFDIKRPSDIGLGNRSLDEQTTFADINGDGLLDMVYSEAAPGQPPTWRYQLNAGGRFLPSVDTGVKDERNIGVGVVSTFSADMDGSGTDELLYPEKVVVPYCIGKTEKIGNGASIDNYRCADDNGGGLDSPLDDLSIYRFAVLKFVASADGRLHPVVNHDSNIVAQANLVSTGDLHGNGLTDVLSPFSPWYADGKFRGQDRKFYSCPPVYGCGLHVSSNAAADHQESVNAMPDLMMSTADALGYKNFWDYYPLSTTKTGFYDVKPVGSQGRYLDEDRYYFTSPMYVVGAYGGSSGVGDGYDAYSYQYGDGMFDTAGRGLIGLRYDIIHDLSTKYREIRIFDQRFPLTGRVLTQWKVKETTLDDGLEKGAPPPDHGYAVVQTWDCEAPKGSAASRELKCLDSPGPTYSYRLRHSTDHDWDSGLQQWTDVDTNYDFDLYTNEIRRTTKTTSMKQVDSAKHSDATTQMTMTLSAQHRETTDISTRYAPPDLANWIIARRAEQKTDKLVETDAALNIPAEKKQTDEDDTYEYGKNGWLKRTVQKGLEAYVETTTFTRGEDPASADYGWLNAVSLTRSAQEDAPPDYLKSSHIGYDAEGYFATSISSAGATPDTFEQDPATGHTLQRVEGGVTETYKYDILGRAIFYEKQQQDKDPVVWSADYEWCKPSLCPTDAVYFGNEIVNKVSVAITYYDKRDIKINHPQNSFLKDD
jgi:hypothetical protein